MAPIVIGVILEGGRQSEDIQSLLETLRSHDELSVQTSVAQSQSKDTRRPQIAIMLSKRGQITDLASLLVWWVRTRPTAVQLTISRQGGRSASIETFIVRPLSDADCAELVERISRILSESTMNWVPWVLLGLGLTLTFAVAGWFILSDLGKDKNSTIPGQGATALPPAAPSTMTEPVVLHLYNIQFNQIQRVPGGDSLRIAVNAAAGEVTRLLHFVASWVGT